MCDLLTVVAEEGVTTKGFFFSSLVFPDIGKFMKLPQALI